MSRADREALDGLLPDEAETAHEIENVLEEMCKDAGDITRLLEDLLAQARGLNVVHNTDGQRPDAG